MKKMKKMAMLVPMMVILSLASVGVIYAIYSELTSVENNTDDRYAIITPQGVETTDGLFSATIYYNTEVVVTNSTRTVTYMLNPTCVTEITVSGADHDVILLKEVTFRVEQTGGSDDYAFEMTKTSGTMTGTYYVGMATSEDDSTYSAWDYKAFNTSTGVSYADIDSDVEYLKLRLYVDTSFLPNNATSPVTPMSHVTFYIRATMDD